MVIVVHIIVVHMQIVFRLNKPKINSHMQVMFIYTVFSLHLKIQSIGEIQIIRTIIKILQHQTEW